ncbi:restriction endonuclease subunit S, partial [Roseibium sp.]|uniref:restriction endonuclease subunit S n=1 Tax=Roseibium sp. TaxID=1936156 RepID=UPI001B2516F7
MSGPLRLGNVCSKIGSGATPRGGKNNYLESGPFTLIRSQNVLNSGFEKTGLAFISNEQAQRLDGVAVERSDVLLNITGDSVARVCQVAEDVLPARVNQHVAIIRPDPALLDPRFLRYFMVQPSYQDFLLSMASSGATRNALTKGMIEDFEIPSLPIDRQREIAAILGALDDKIELNRKTAATLEEMARALYRSWFVDFDPVWAKLEGRAPAHMDAATAALFPDRFDEEGLPDGWGMGKISDLGRVVTGKTPSTKDPSNYGDFC